LIADISNKVLPMPLPTGLLFACEKEALDAENVTSESERFIRTHHPCFADAADVYVFEHPAYDPVWVVGPAASSAAKWLRVAGREVHVHRQSGIVPGSLSPLSWQDPIWPAINPRKLLPEDDLALIMRLFPEVDGVRIHIAGYITLLLSTERNISALLNRPFPETIGGLQVEISLFDMLPTATAASWGDQTAPTSNEFMATSTCLGLRIRLPGAKEDAITTATHGHVTLPTGLPWKAPEQTWNRIAFEARAIRIAVATSSPVVRLASLPAISWALSFRKAYSPLGRTVFLAGTDRIVS
jgi:hypothetical protein